MRQVCKEAKVTPSVFTRWKAGRSRGPNVGSLQKMLNVLAQHSDPED